MLSRPQAYLLQNSVTHARLLPTEAAHAFTYPTLALLVSLKALERGKLDLARGWIFGYGGRWCRMTGLRPTPYLEERQGTIMAKLNAILKTRGCAEVEDAWMMTMPSFMGVEGINPLTVYFCYDASASFCFTVLEVRLISLNCFNLVIMVVRYTTRSAKVMYMSYRSARMKPKFPLEGMTMNGPSIVNFTSRRSTIAQDTTPSRSSLQPTHQWQAHRCQNCHPDPLYAYTFTQMQTAEKEI